MKSAQWIIFGGLATLLLACEVEQQPAEVPQSPTTKSTHYFLQDTMIQELYGDLTGDGLPERVQVWLSGPPLAGENRDKSPGQRFLLISRHNGEAWKLMARSDRAILDTGDGGVHGDPFESIEINEGSLKILHYGGSSWRWTEHDTYHWDGSEFVLTFHQSSYGKECFYFYQEFISLQENTVEVLQERSVCEGKSWADETLEEFQESFQSPLPKITLNNRFYSGLHFDIESSQWKARVMLGR